MSLTNPTVGLRETLERLSVGLLLGAVTCAMVLGTGASVGSRIAVQSIAALAVLATIASMVAEGVFRILRCPLWIAPAGLIVLGAAQMLPLPSILGGAASLDSLPRPAPLTATANRHATQEGILVWCGVLFVCAVAGHQIRTRARAAVAAALISAVLVLSGLIGLCSGSGAADGSWFDAETIVGPLAYRTGFDFDATGVWLTHRTRLGGSFGLFWDRSAFAACAIGFLPWLAAVAVESSTNGGRSAVSLTCAALGSSLWALTVVVGDAGVVVAGVAAAALLWTICPSEHRTSLLRTTAIGAVIAALGLAYRGFGGEASEGVFSSTTRWWADNRSLASALWDLGWLGGGLGALADVWPMYRDAPAEVAPDGSSLLMLLVEVGVGGACLLAGLLVAACVQWKRVRSRLDVHTRLHVGGLSAGLAGMLGVGVLGSGLEAPGVLVAAALLLGCLARGISGPNAWTGGNVVA